jgi:hypothetical protein
MGKNQDISNAINYLVEEITGLKVGVAAALCKVGKNEYETHFQIMPAFVCNQECEDFFDWYCDEKPDGQFHTDPSIAAAKFVSEYYRWKSLKQKAA